MVILYTVTMVMAGTQPNKDFKVFKKHRPNGHLYTILLSMPMIKQESSWQSVKY